jgi:SAM-dependent methyltransferase
MRRFVYYPIKYKLLSAKDKFRTYILTKFCYNLIKSPDYPTSAMRIDQSIRITLVGAAESLRIMNEILSFHESGDKTISVSDYDSPRAEILRNAFDSYGSDKGSYHGYHRIYAEILDKIQTDKITIGEIGVGSTNKKIPSNMGKAGTPGASLAVWASLSNVKEVVGFDIDKDILFNQGKIQCIHLNQIDDASWTQAKKILKFKKFDLIIDDGLHAPIANLQTIKYTIDWLKPKGVIVIEDIGENSLPIWQLLVRNGIADIHMEIFRTNHAYALVARKLD